MNIDRLIARLEMEPEPEPAEEDRPTFTREEGHWPVIITDAEERFGSSGQLWLDVRFIPFHRGRALGDRIWMTKLNADGKRLSFAFPADKQILPVLKAGKGHLETKELLLTGEKVFILHRWSV